MLSEPELYSQLSVDHVREAAEAMASVAHLIPSTPGEAVLDIGAGTGDVTVNVVLPSLHPKYSIMVGSDISTSMVSYAQKRWKSDRLKWMTLDAQETSLTRLSLLPVTQFDKIFSFFALQWVRDRRQVARNVSSLLKSGGTALLVLVVRSGVYPVWDHMASSSSWAQYFSDVKVPINEYQYMEYPDIDLREKLIEEGLDVIYCQIKSHANAFSTRVETDDEKIVRLRTVDPLVGRLPKQLREDYLKDLLKYVKSTVSPRGAVDYSSLTIVCRKHF